MSDYSSSCFGDPNTSFKIADQIYPQITDTTFFQPAFMIPGTTSNSCMFQSDGIPNTTGHRVTAMSSISPSNTPSTHTPSPTAYPSLSPPSTSCKAKSLKEPPVADINLCQSRKRSHIVTEKRYRANLNESLDKLRACVPSLYRSFDSKMNGKHDFDPELNMGCRANYGKSAMLTRALDYIKHLEAANQKLDAEGAILKTQLGAIEKFAMKEIFGSDDLTSRSTT